MNIGIDIDDTITDTFEYLMEPVSEYFKLDLNYLRENNISYSNLPEEYAKHAFEFGKKTYAGLLRKIPLKQGAKEYINKLKTDGHSIFIITARDERLYLDAYGATKDQLDYFGITYDKLICSYDKRNACVENSIDIFIDDSIKNLNSIEDLNIEKILYTTSTNINTSTEYKRVYNWEEIYEYISKKENL